MGVSDTGINGEREFPATSWSAIRHAGDPRSPEYERSLRRLVELYWRPVYGVIRHAWSKSNQDAKDLTQEFFATVIFDRGLIEAANPERGSFRGLLRKTLTNFMRNTARDAGRQKRGGGAVIVSMETADLDECAALGDTEQLTPEELFDVAWNRTVLAAAMRRLEEKLAAEGKATTFEMFRRCHLEAGGGEDASYEEVGTALGFSPSQSKRVLRRAKEAFRQSVTEVVRTYVDGRDELAAELRRLMGR